MPNKIQAIVLAAGQSKRFGSDKTKIKIDGIPIAIKISQTLQAIQCQPLIVVNENNPGLIECAKKHSIQTVINDIKQNTGIGSSIALGVKTTPHAEGWLICLADMPFIQQTTYKNIVLALQNKDSMPIILPRYKLSSGHPVGFKKEFYQALLNKQGDTGAKDIINQHLNQVEYIDTDDRNILQDIDTPQDFKSAEF